MPPFSRRPAARIAPGTSRPVALVVRLALAGLPSATGSLQAQTVLPPQAAAPAHRTYDIPAGPLGAAIARLVAQSGAPVAADAALTRGRTSGAVQGSYTVQEALTRLLAGTGAEAALQPDGSYALRLETLSAVPVPASTAAAPAQAAVALPEVRVTGNSTVASARRTYKAVETDSVTRSETPLLEAPQAIQVVTRALLDDRGSTKLNDVLGAVSGVNAFSFYSDFVYRGFRSQDNAASVWNGIKAFGGLGFFHFGQDLANVERIEVLKGPGALLFSSDQPGGTMNVITKRPQAVPRSELSASIGRYSTGALAADLTGPLNADKTVLYRLNLAGDTSDTFRDRQQTSTRLFAPALTWVISPRTRLDLEYEAAWDRRRAAFDRGIPAPDGVLGVVPPGWSATESTDRSRSNSQTAYASLKHRVDDELEFTVGARLFDKSERDRDTLTDGVLDADTVARRHERFDDDNRGYNVTAYGIKTAQWLRMKHQILFGADFGQLRRRYVIDTYAGSLDLSIRNPVYGLPADIDTNRSSPSITDQKTRNTAFYLQDSIELNDRWRALLGVRHERYRNRETDQTGQAATTNRNNDSQLIPRFGLVYLLQPNWSLYGSSSRSFSPQYGFYNGAGLGGPFDPERGRQLEIGSKWDTLDGRLSTTLALYRIVKNNVVVSDPADPDRYVQTGEVQSRGLEIDVNGALAANWKINANYSYNDIEITEDTTGLKGKRTENAPRHLAGLFTRYDFIGTGFGIGGGLQHVGGNREDFSRALRLPSYTLVNLAAYWRASPNFDLQLNVQNLFDKAHYVGSYGDYAVFPGQPRDVKLTGRWRF